MRDASQQTAQPNGKQAPSTVASNAPHGVISDAQIGAAAMGGNPGSMFPKIPVPPAEVGMGISALDERIRQGSLRSQLSNGSVKPA